MGDWCILAAIIPIWRSLGVLGVPGLSRRTHFPIWHSIGPDAKRPTYYCETADGATATPFFQKPHKRGNGCILVASIPILVFLGVQWGSVAPRGFRFALISPIWSRIDPNAQTQRITSKTADGATGAGDAFLPEAK